MWNILILASKASHFKLTCKTTLKFPLTPCIFWMIVFFCSFLLLFFFGGGGCLELYHERQAGWRLKAGINQRNAGISPMDQWLIKSSPQILVGSTNIHSDHFRAALPAFLGVYQEDIRPCSRPRYSARGFLLYGGYFRDREIILFWPRELGWNLGVYIFFATRRPNYIFFKCKTDSKGTIRGLYVGYQAWHCV